MGQLSGPSGVLSLQHTPACLTGHVFWKQVAGAFLPHPLNFKEKESGQEIKRATQHRSAEDWEVAVSSSQPSGHSSAVPNSLSDSVVRLDSMVFWFPIESGSPQRE